MTKIKTTEHPHSLDMRTFPPRTSSEILAGLRKFYEAGVPEAVHSALYICRAFGTAPAWVLEGAYIEVSKFIAGEKFDQARVVEGERRKLSTMRAEVVRWATVVKLHEEYDLTLEEACEAAVDFLQKRGSFPVASSTVRAAYKRVSRELKSSETARLYYFGLFPTRMLLEKGTDALPDLCDGD